eukprot:scaffold90949_cov60-Phaeocystis_antarctica.AAC.4
MRGTDKRASHLSLPLPASVGDICVWISARVQRIIELLTRRVHGLLACNPLWVHLLHEPGSSTSISLRVRIKELSEHSARRRIFGCWWSIRPERCQPQPITLIGARGAQLTSPARITYVRERGQRLERSVLQVRGRLEQQRRVEGATASQAHIRRVDGRCQRHLLGRQLKQAPRLSCRHDGLTPRVAAVCRARLG